MFLQSLISMGTRTFDLEILATDGLHANRASMKVEGDSFSYLEYESWKVFKVKYYRNQVIL